MLRFGCFASILLASLLAVAAPASDSVKTLAPQFRRWLVEEVPYIIQSEERKEFLALRSDAERDNFIQEFWEARNPNPGAEVNTYKQDHYRRLAYANDHFGNTAAKDGWRSDLGRIYITLGEPQQKTTYPAARNVRPLILWFYESQTPALPTHFYVLFYKRTAGEPYTLYSPYQDGPSRLTTGLEDLNVQDKSLQTIRKSLGDEVARATLSLIPTEPVDLNSYSPNLASDVMLSTIRGLPDNALERQHIHLNKSRERATASILSNTQRPEFHSTVVRDGRGRTTLDTLLQFHDPDPSLIGQRRDGSLGYDLTVRTRIATSDGKPIYEDVKDIAARVQPGQADAARTRRLLIENSLPLIPGSYSIETTLTNNLNLSASRFAEKVTVPTPRLSALGISNPLVYTGSPVQDPTGDLPFSLAHLRFAPRALQTVDIHPGERLPLVFEIWLPSSPAPRPPSIHLHYLYGSLSQNAKPLGESDENVETANADSAGNLVTGHTLNTADLIVGRYQVVLRADAEGLSPAFTTLSLRVVPPETPLAQWSAYGPLQPGDDDIKRGLTAQALGRAEEAKIWFTGALDANGQNAKALSSLVALLSATGKIGDLAALYDRPAFRNAVDPNTLLLVSEAVAQKGNPRQAIDLINAQIAMQPPSALLYAKLAEYYDETGHRDEGDQARKQAQALRTTHP